MGTLEAGVLGNRSTCGQDAASQVPELSEEGPSGGQARGGHLVPRCARAYLEGHGAVNKGPRDKALSWLITDF